MLLVQLFGDLHGVGVEDQSLQDYCVDFLFLIGLFVLVVHANDGRLVAYAEA